MGMMIVVAEQIEKIVVDLVGYLSPGEPPFSEIFQSNLISLIRGGKYCSFIVVSSIIQL